MNEFLEYQTQDVMTREVVHVSPHTTLAEVEEIFETHEFNGLPVLDGDGAFVGIVTKQDILSAFCEDDEHIFPPYSEILKREVASVMTRDVSIVWPRTPLSRVVEKLSRGRWKSIPVCDDGVLCGIVSREDVLCALRRAAAGEGPLRNTDGNR